MEPLLLLLKAKNTNEWDELCQTDLLSIILHTLACALHAGKVELDSLMSLFFFFLSKGQSVIAFELMRSSFHL